MITFIATIVAINLSWAQVAIFRAKVCQSHRSALVSRQVDANDYPTALALDVGQGSAATARSLHRS